MVIIIKSDYFDKEQHYFQLNYEDVTITNITGEIRNFVKADIYSQEQFDFIGNYSQNVFKIIYLAIEKRRI